LLVIRCATEFSVFSSRARRIWFLSNWQSSPRRIFKLQKCIA